MDKQRAISVGWSCIAASALAAASGGAGASRRSSTLARPPACSRQGRLHRLVSPFGAYDRGQDHRLSREFRRAAARAITSTSNSRCRSPRPTRIGSRSTAAISCREQTCSRRPEHRGTTSWRLECRAGWVRSRSNGLPSSPNWLRRGARRSSRGCIKAGQPILRDRVVIAPSPYPGAMGIEAANNFNNTIVRSQQAATNFPLPPTESAAIGSSMT